jgi:hypothetical protein
MHGSSLVYANTAINSTHGVINLGQHTDCIKLWNQSETTSAAVKFNGQYTVVIPHTSNTGVHSYYEVCGDYTTIEVLTASCTISVYAIG